MKQIKSLSLVVLFATLLGLSFTACSKDDVEPTPTQKSENIVEIASRLPEFSILVDAVKRAGLVDVLSSDGNFTVFAPTNAAFENLLSELGVSKLEDIPVETLKSVLLYHVLGSKVLSSQVESGYVSTSATGTGGKNLSLFVNVVSGSVKLDNRATVTQVDVMANNGVIHVIDKVLLPNKIVQIALNDPSFSSLVAAVVYADLVGALSTDGSFTVFAPTNQAFTDLLAAAGVSQVTDLPKDVVTAVLLDHVVSGNVTSSDLSNGSVPTLGENNIVVSGVGTTPKLNGDISISAVDIQGVNGVFHRIDKVIFNY